MAQNLSSFEYLWKDFCYLVWFSTLLNFQFSRFSNFCYWVWFFIFEIAAAKTGPPLFFFKVNFWPRFFYVLIKSWVPGGAGFGSKNWKLPWRQRHFFNNFFGRKAGWMLLIYDYSSSASATEVDGCQDQLVAAWRNRGQDGSPNQHLLRNFKNYNFENFWKLAHCFPVGSACVLLRPLPLAQVLGA